MLKRILLSSIFFTASLSQAENSDPAYIQQQVRETLNGMQNNAKNETDDARNLVNSSYSNSYKYQSDAAQLANTSRIQLNSAQSKKDQAWAEKTIHQHNSDPRLNEYKKTGQEICENGKRYVPSLGCKK